MDDRCCIKILPKVCFSVGFLCVHFCVDLKGVYKMMLLISGLRKLLLID